MAEFVETKITENELPGALAGHSDSDVFAWKYVRFGALDAQIHREKQHYPGSWVESGRYTIIIPLYVGPASSEPSGWAYRTSLGGIYADWQFSVVQPVYSGELGGIEIIPLYEREPVATEVSV